MKSKKIWIGRWLGAVALLHTLFALVVFTPIYQRLLQQGWFNSVGEDPLLNAAVWFLLFGAPLALLAVAVHAMEKNGEILFTCNLEKKNRNEVIQLFSKKLPSKKYSIERMPMLSLDIELTDDLTNLMKGFIIKRLQ